MMYGVHRLFLVKLFFPFLAISFLLSSPLLGAIDLVRDGKAVATVVVPDKAFSCVSLAAEELVYHLERSTGAKLQISKESQRPEQGPFLFVGACRATAKAAGRLHGKSLAEQDFG